MYFLTNDIKKKYKIWNIKEYNETWKKEVKSTIKNI